MNRAQLSPSFPRISALRQPFTVYIGITKHVECVQIAVDILKDFYAMFIKIKYFPTWISSPR